MSEPISEANSRQSSQRNTPSQIIREKPTENQQVKEAIHPGLFLPNKNVAKQRVATHPFFISRKTRNEIVKNLDAINLQELQLLSLEILKTTKDRQKDELLVLRKATEKIDFFKKLLETQDEDTLYLCLKNMSLESYKQHSIVFEKGDQASKFYIIIAGQVGVYIKDNTNEQNKEKNKLEKEREKQKEKEKEKEEKIKSVEDPEFRYRRSNTIVAPQVKRQQHASKSRQQTILGVTQLPGNAHSAPLRAILLSQKLGEQSLQGIKIQRLLKVNELHAGASFGELALINEAPRLATIVCELDCDFAVLNKIDYKGILLEADRKKVQKNVQELSENPGFQNLSRRLLNILLYAFKPIHYSYREFVYKQGDLRTWKALKGQRCDDIFIVQTGDFAVICNTSLTPMMFYEQLKSQSKVMERQFHGKTPSQLAVLGKGSIFGEDEAFLAQPRKYSVQCQSERGSVLSISLRELVQRVQVTNETALIEFIQQLCQEKALWRQFFHDQTKEVLDAYKNLISNVESLPNYQNRYINHTRTRVKSEQNEARLDKQQNINLSIGPETSYYNKHQNDIFVPSEQNNPFLTSLNEAQDQSSNKYLKYYQYSNLNCEFIDQFRPHRVHAHGTKIQVDTFSLYDQKSRSIQLNSIQKQQRSIQVTDFYHEDKSDNFSPMHTFSKTLQPNSRQNNRHPIIKSPQKEMLQHNLKQENQMELRYGRIMEAKQGLLQKIYGAKEINTNNMEEMRLDFGSQKKKNIVKKANLNKSLMVKVSDNNSEYEIDQSIANSHMTNLEKLSKTNQNFTGQQMTVYVGTSKNKHDSVPWPIQVNLYLNDLDTVFKKSIKDQPIQKNSEEFQTLQRVLNNGKNLRYKKRNKQLTKSYVEFLNQQRSASIN